MSNMWYIINSSNVFHLIPSFDTDGRMVKVNLMPKDGYNKPLPNRLKKNPEFPFASLSFRYYDKKDSTVQFHNVVDPLKSVFSPTKTRSDFIFTSYVVVVFVTLFALVIYLYNKRNFINRLFNLIKSF